jgi:hypothetical protein
LLDWTTFRFFGMRSRWVLKLQKQFAPAIDRLYHNGS